MTARKISKSDQNETRFQRIAREQRERRAARDAKAKAPQTRYAAEKRIADRIDGYDRDDLGHSPDY